jgi:hypothetical protein
MSFQEKVEIEVKELAAFRCCKCQSIGVEVHHIIPGKEGGSKDIDNAVPLCAKCHADFADIPQKREEIQQMRDWRYKTAAEMFSPRSDLAHLELKINDLVPARQQNSEGLGNLKETLIQ